MRPRVVICGSFHRDPTGIKRLFRELEATGCRILSPLSLSFNGTAAAVVRLKSEAEFTSEELEKYHLRAIKEAHLVWLYTPGGYVGLSSAYELGYAVALGKKVFTLGIPQDEMLASQVLQVASVFEALEIISWSAS